MRWIKNRIVVIGIDHGYGNIKTANTVTPQALSLMTASRHSREMFSAMRTSITVWARDTRHSFRIRSKCWTEKLGVEQCVIRIKNAVMDKFGTALDDTHIKSIIMTGKADISEKYLDVIRPVISGYCKDVFDSLRKYDYNPDMMRRYIPICSASFITAAYSDSFRLDTLSAPCLCTSSITSAL